MQQQSYLQEGTEQTVLLRSVSPSTFNLFRNHLLAEQHQSQELKKTQQPDKEGRFCSGNDCGSTGGYGANTK